MATVVADILGLTDPVVPRGFRDMAPDTTPYPLLTVREDVYPSLKVRSGDGRTLAWRHTHQIDLWQDVDGEDDTILPRLVQAIEGAKGTGGRRGFHVASTQRVVDYDDDAQDLVHVTVLLQVIEPR